MKPIKMFGLAALAALMAMAFVGASSAMAGNTQLCTTDTNPCGSPVTLVHEVSAGKAKIKFSSFPTMECNVLFSTAVTEGNVGALGVPQILNGSFTYSSCNNFCSVTEINGPAEIKVLRTAAELASVTGEFEVHMSCPFINCTYNGEGVEGDDKGALAAANKLGEVTINEILLEKVAGGKVCPERTLLTITTAPLTATYIST